MKNFIQKGDAVTLTAPVGGVLSGEFMIAGKLYGVASFTAAAGEAVEAARVGVFTLPKATGEVWSQGDQLYWDATNKRFTLTATGNKEVGVAWLSAVSGATSGEVDIRPGASLAVAE